MSILKLAKRFESILKQSNVTYSDVPQTGTTVQENNWKDIQKYTDYNATFGTNYNQNTVLRLDRGEAFNPIDCGPHGIWKLYYICNARMNGPQAPSQYAGQIVRFLQGSEPKDKRFYTVEN